MPEKHVPKHRAPKKSLFGRPSAPARGRAVHQQADPGPSRTVSIIEAPVRPAAGDAPPSPAAAERPAAPLADDLFAPDAGVPPFRSSEDYFDSLAASKQERAARRTGEAAEAPAGSGRRAAPVRIEPPLHRTGEYALPEPPAAGNGTAATNGTRNGSSPGATTDASPLSIKSAIKADGRAWDPFLKDPEPQSETFGPGGVRAGLDRMRPRRRVRPIQPVTPEERHDHQTLGQWFKEIFILGLIAILTAVLLTNYVVQAFYIPSESMEDTLLINDRVLVNKVVYKLREPQPGDIVVFTSPDRATVAEEESGLFSEALNEAAQGLGLRSSVQDLIKRVVAVEGQTVEVKIGSLFVDGKQVDEPYRKDFLPMPNFGPVTVPEGKVFVMGDNRSQSHDSRAFGAIDADTIVGRAFSLIWPLQRFTWLKN